MRRRDHDLRARLHPPPPPSPEATELGHRIAQVVREFQVQNPHAGRTDVSQAFSVARSLLRSTTGGANAVLLTIAVLGLLALLAGVLAFTLLRGGTLPMVWPIILGAGVIAIAVAALKARG